MIAYLEGIIIAKSPRSLIVGAGGVGYRVFCTQEFLAMAGTAGDSVRLYTMLFVRDEALELYGFQREEEIQLFEALLGVSGIGPRAAQAIIGKGSVESIVKALEEGDERFFSKIPGVGSKKIKKIILELSGKLILKGESAAETRHFQDAKKALRGLGFSAQEVQEVLEEIPQDLTDSKEIVTRALRFFGKPQK